MSETTVNHDNQSDSNLVLVNRTELQRLKDNDEFLSELRAFGVDNWSGYEEARTAMQKRHADMVVMNDDEQHI